ncbi:hypothetical protein P152DRAFT_474891 [Eremomyces bilateralis CBS 781.70]|uniref:BHLH domain-containing protein n=1 Tax=Eremomyces bilateralis CBS 781.70 TaxID=1392243 RepID=A0A6G1FZY6_9PEZI|nr:uncharacterized protein P152DRAFT_474891 [Eremomyces bilateralis CBS 781.70]KAF1811292.1 hypothetical protein P152DRAFT_474891 [Eremomyces bilateralis CBS 781.70]
MSSSPAAKSPASGSATGKPEKPRLSEQEKKNNHIASEQKRRQAIRDGFDRLANVVPGMAGQGRSEAVVLQATIEFLRQQLVERQDYIDELRSRGVNVEGYVVNGVDINRLRQILGSNLHGFNGTGI